MGAGNAVAHDAIGLLAGDVAAGEADAARIGRIDPVDQIEDGGLAGAVRADQAENLPLLHGETQILDRAHAAEAQAQIVDFQERVHSRIFRVLGQRR